MVGPNRPPSVPARQRPQDAPRDIARAWQLASSPPSTVTTRVAERLNERRAAARAATRRRWGTRVAALVVLVAALWAVGASGLFALRSWDVTLEGPSAYVDSGEVEAIVSAHRGQSLLWMNAADVVDQLESLPGVGAVEVVRVWPSRLAITVTARTPVAAIPRGAEWVIVDDQGHTIAVTQAAPHGIPVIVVPIGADHVRVQQAVLAVLYELPAQVREQVVSVSADTQDSVTLVLEDGLVVEWGSSDQSPLKAQVLAAMLASPFGSDVAVIDVTAPTLPVTRSDT